MADDPLRWGILGTAHIARKNWRAIQASGLGEIVAVASRDLTRANAFIDENQAVAPFPVRPQAFGSYGALLAAREVEAVYIPLPTGIRREWVLRAAAAGKHIVCEKPCTTTVEGLREILDACRRHRVQFMDGVMFMHSPRLARLREVLDDGATVGELRRITCGFSYRAAEKFFTENIRTDPALEPHGCLGDLGWYCIRLALWAARGQPPQTVTGRILQQISRPDRPTAVATEFAGELFFPGGVSAAFYCSFVSEFHQWARLDGTRGHLTMDDFVLPRADALSVKTI